MIHIEVRKKIINARRKGLRVSEICAAYDVGKSAVYKLLKQERELGSIAPRTHTRGRKPRLSEAELEALDHLLQTRKDITLEQMKKELDLPICVTAISWNIRHKLGYQYKNRQYTPVSKRNQHHATVPVQGKPEAPKLG